MIIYYLGKNNFNYIKNIDLNITKDITDIIVKYAFICGICEGYYHDITDSYHIIVCLCCNSTYCKKCQYKIPKNKRIWNH